MSNYLLAIGGTGNKILEALVYACAADALCDPNSPGRTPLGELHALIIDVDAACGNTTRAKQAAEHYEAVRAALETTGTPRRGFHTRLSVNQWNMNLAQRANSVAGVTRNNRRDRLLAQSLFSRTEAELEYSEGFRGHPDLGVLFFADLLSHLDATARTDPTDEMVRLLDTVRQELATGQTVSVMLVGSIFGGTGASGIPSVSRFLRERFRDRADRLVLSAVLMLPYYDVPPATADETLEIVVKSSAFLDKARTALQYYGMEGMIRSGEEDDRGVFDALYLLGLPKEAFVTARFYSTGSQSQENDAHLMEWLAARCAAAFFRTSFRGADAHNINCYYYQWHSHEVSWDSFDDESVPYRVAFGGLAKAAALFFSECYPTLRDSIRRGAGRKARAVNYWTAYFYGARRYNAQENARLEKLVQSLYRFLAFYANWLWQVLRTLPPNLRPEGAAEADARALAETYRELIDVRALLAAPPAGQPAGARAGDTHAVYEKLSRELETLSRTAGGSAYLSAVKAEKDRRAARLEEQRLAVSAQQQRVALWEGEDAHLIDPQTLRQEKARLEAMRRACAGMEVRLALVEEDEAHAAQRRVPQPPAPETGALPRNDLFHPEALDALHSLLTLYGADPEADDPVAARALRLYLWDHFTRLVAQRVPDRRTAAQAVAGMGGGHPTGAGPEAAFAGFTAALLAAVVEEESV